jgi:DNA-binding MarR family transcriptional regulator
MLMRTRLIARVLTAMYDEELRPFQIGSAQFAMLVVIYKMQPATRAAIGRFHHQDRSTLTRNLKILLSEGWIEEVPDTAGGRGRPIVLTKAGKALLHNAQPAWQAAQTKAKSLLSPKGESAVMDVANRIMSAQASA